MNGQGYFAPQFRQGVQMDMPTVQQDCPPYPSTSIQTSTTTSQYYMVHQGYSSVTAHLGQPDSTIYSHLSLFPVPLSGTPNSGHPYLIPPPQLHLNGTQLMQSFPSTQLDLQWTQNVYQIHSHYPPHFLLSPGRAPSRGLVCPTFPVGVQGVQPTLQPDPPLSSSMLYAHAFGSIAYTAPQVFQTPSALVLSLPPPPPQVPPPLPPSSPLGRPHACVMSSATLLPSSSHINQFWYDSSSRPSLIDCMRNTGVRHLNTGSDIVMEDDITQIKEGQVIPEKLHELQLPTLPTQNSLAKNLSSSESPVLQEGKKVSEHRLRTLPINPITARSGAPNTVGEDYLISLRGHGLIRSGTSSHGDAHTTPVLLSMGSPAMRLQSFRSDNQHLDNLLCSVSRNNADWHQPSYHFQDQPITDGVSVHVDEPADNSSLMSSYKSNSVDTEQSVYVYKHSDENNTVAADVESKAYERNKKGKRSKLLKRFKVVLTKFVKKVLGPSWRQCTMSKEVFKMIVKKTVDKVSGSLKPHHIPNSQAKIDRYIDSSRSKLTSLVMAYVDKYVRV